MRLIQRIQAWLPILVGALAVAVPAAAQEAGLPGAGGQSLRPYAFVFIAYTVLWVLVFGWLFSVARRLARLERRLDA